MTAEIDVSTYLVADARISGPRGVLHVIGEAVAGGVTTVQVREKEASARELLDLTVRVAAFVGDRAAVIVDDRVDVFLAARASGAAVHGVHVGQSDLPALDARRLVGADAVVGLTANTPEHLAAVDALPRGTVDYLGVGVIRPTTTKPDHPVPLGVDGFRLITEKAGMPCVAIGGVRLEDTDALRSAGAAGLAVVSAICGAPDPRAAAAAFRDAWSASPAPTAVDDRRRAMR